jgi:hypothetical protein
MEISKKASLLWILALLLILVIGFLVVNEGLAHGYAQSYFSQAREYFNDGKYGKALKYGVTGTRVALDSGARWTIGKHPFLSAQNMLFEGADLYSALEKCEFARTIIGNYDTEGAVSYLCWRIETEIDPNILQDPSLPVPTRKVAP